MLIINIYHLLSPLSWGVTEDVVARISGELTGVLQSGHQRSDRPASSQGPQGLSYKVSGELLELSGLREEISQQGRGETSSLLTSFDLGSVAE